MATLTPVNVASGRSTQHRDSYAQIGDLVFFSNGHDALSVWNLRNNTAFSYGMAAPAAPTQGTSPGAGNVSGRILYRVRWYDDTVQTYSLPSAVLDVTVSNIQVLINQPGSVPSRATHWVLERTANGDDVFYPVQTVAIATTTATDNLADADLEEFEALVLQENQGQPEFIPRKIFQNQGILFGVGGRIHRASASLTNSSADVNTGSEFTQQMDTEEQDLTVPTDADGAVYKINGYTSDTQIAITPVYAGSTGTKTVAITGRRDRVWWSEGDNPEHGGEKRGGVLRNQAFLGDDGEEVVSGCGLGPVGCLYAKGQSLYFHRFNQSPNAPSKGDGAIVKLQSRRGCIGPEALRFQNGAVYGMDRYGIWKMQPGGEPQEIAEPLAKLWKDGSLSFANGDNWHIAWDPAKSWLIFFMCLSGETYPTTGWVWDLKQNQWRGTLKFPLGITCAAELPDSSGVMRMAFWTVRDPAGAGIGSYHYILNDNYCQGADPSTTVNATATSSSNNTVECSAASFKTTGAGCMGLQVRKVTSAGASETRNIVSNTDQSLAVSSNWTVNPVAGDKIIVGGIETKYRSGRIFAGEPLRRKRFRGVWITLAKLAASKSVYLKAYYDGDTDAAANPTTKSEDGVAQTAASAITTLTMDGQDTTRRFYVPLHGPGAGTDATRWATDIELELYSFEPDATPWEIMSMELEYEVQDKIQKDAA